MPPIRLFLSDSAHSGLEPYAYPDANLPPGSSIISMAKTHDEGKPRIIERSLINNDRNIPEYNVTVISLDQLAEGLDSGAIKSFTIKDAILSAMKPEDL